MSKDAIDHDALYRAIYENALTVVHLLRGFIRHAWLRDADFSTLEQVKDTHISDSLDAKRRNNDVIWRLQLHDGRWLYVYVMLEFQTTIDRTMPLRMMTYMGLLWQRLVKNKELGPDRKLPPILPIVIYNGDSQWTAPLALSDLLPEMPPGMESFAPQCRYLLLDEQHLADPGDPVRNIVANMCALESLPSPEMLENLLGQLDALLEGEEHDALWRNIDNWLLKSILPDQPTGHTIEARRNARGEGMLANRVKKWGLIEQEKGEARGLEKGMIAGAASAKEQARIQQAQLCIQVLEKRFGTVDPFSRRRIEQASEQELTQWFLDLYDAQSVRALVGEE